MVFAFTSDIVSLTINGSKACHEGKSKILTEWDDHKSQIT